MLSILIAITGAIIAGSILKKRKRRKRTVTTRTVYARNTSVKSPEQLEKDRRKAVSEYNRRIKADLEKRQASDDIIHLEQRKRDLLKAYEQLPETDTEKNIRKRVAYDNAIRQTEKQIEKAYMVLHRSI